MSTGIKTFKFYCLVLLNNKLFFVWNKKCIYYVDSNVKFSCLIQRIVVLLNLLARWITVTIILPLNITFGLD